MIQVLFVTRHARFLEFLPLICRCISMSFVKGGLDYSFEYSIKKREQRATTAVARSGDRFLRRTTTAVMKRQHMTLTMFVCLFSPPLSPNIANLFLCSTLHLSVDNYVHDRGTFKPVECRAFTKLVCLIPIRLKAPLGHFANGVFFTFFIDVVVTSLTWFGP